MELKKKSNILAEEEPKYIISLKKGYRILHIIMSILFLSCTLYFGMISFRAGTDTMVFGIGFTGIFLVFLLSSLNSMPYCHQHEEDYILIINANRVKGIKRSILIYKRFILSEYVV